MDVTKIAEALQVTGGWGLSAVLLGVIWFLVRTIYKLVQRRDYEIKEQNQKLFEMIEERISIDIEHREAFKQLRETIKELIPLLRGGF